jgi:tetratricopeptide (TPR) repeat protein
LLKGRFFWNKRTSADLKKAVAYFDQAIERDPGYAQAYAGLANSYVTMLMYEFGRGDFMCKSQQAAAKALELDPTIGEAYCVLGSIHHANFDWKNAEVHFQRAIELDPNYATAHQWYGQLLNDLGRFAEGLSEAKRAMALDPFSLPVRFGAGLILLQMKRYEEAADLSGEGIELDPSFPWSYYVRGLVAEAQGKLDESIRYYHEARLLAHDDPSLLGDIGRACARLGRKEDAMTALRELRDFHEKGYLVSFSIANVYLGLGDKANTFAWLERSLDDHETMITDIITFPAWDGLRSEPRFIALLKKMGLPQ